MNKEISFPLSVQPFMYPKNTIVGLQPNLDEWTDNPLYFTAIYHKIVKKLGAEKHAAYSNQRRYFNTYIEQCAKRDFGKKILGLYSRRPNVSCSTLTHGEFAWDEYFYPRIISQDEMIGLVSFFYDNNMQKELNEIYEYGKKTFWSYDNRCPNEFTFRGFQARFLYAVPLYKIAAKRSVGLFGQILFCIDCIISTRYKYETTNQKLLYWTMSDVVLDKGPWLMRKAMSYFGKKMNQMYGSVGGMMEVYFGAHHPFTSFSKKVMFKE